MAADQEQTPPASGATILNASDEAASIYGRAGVVTLFTLLSRVMGMARDLVVSHRFGAGSATDAWVQAFRIPNALRRLTAEGSMTIAFIPIYVSVREQEGAGQARRFAQQVLGLVLFATALLTAAGMLLSPWITVAVAPGFLGDPEKYSLAVDLMRWTFPYLLLVSVVAWAMGVLNAEQRFAAPAAAPVFLNVGIILAVLLLADGMARPIMAIAWGVLAGGIVQVLLQGPSLRQAHIPWWPRWDWNNEPVRRLFALLGPSIAGVAVYQVNIIVLGIIASYLPTGQIFHYNNATRLSELVWGLFAFSFTMAGYPTLSEHHARQDWPRMRDTLRFTSAALLYAVLPSMAGLIAVAPGIVSMLYLHGAYTAQDVAVTAQTLQLLAFGIPAIALVRMMTPVFYAFADARTPVLVSGATLLVTAALGWWLSQTMQVLGLALGLSLGAWFQVLMLAALLRRRAAVLGPWFPWGSTLRQGLVTAGMGVSVAWGDSLGRWEQGPASLYNWLLLVAVIGLAVAFYLGVTLALSDEQARHWIALVQRQVRKLRRNRPPAGKG